MERLFAYGTIQDPIIQQKIIGRTVALQPNSLEGFRLSEITLDDGTFLIAIPDKKSSETVFGHTLEITVAELAKFDDYETDAYQRSQVKLKSGQKAWIYHQ